MKVWCWSPGQTRAEHWTVCVWLCARPCDWLCGGRPQVRHKGKLCCFFQTGPYFPIYRFFYYCSCKSPGAPPDPYHLNVFQWGMSTSQCDIYSCPCDETETYYQYVERSSRGSIEVGLNSLLDTRYPVWIASVWLHFISSDCLLTYKLEVPTLNTN